MGRPHALVCEPPSRRERGRVLTCALARRGPCLPRGCPVEYLVEANRTLYAPSFCTDRASSPSSHAPYAEWAEWAPAGRKLKFIHAQARSRLTAPVSRQNIQVSGLHLPYEEGGETRRRAMNCILAEFTSGNESRAPPERAAKHTRPKQRTRRSASAARAPAARQTPS